MADKEPFTLGALWENWKDPESGEWVRTFTIVTTDANELDEAPAHVRPAEREPDVAALGERAIALVAVGLQPSHPLAVDEIALVTQLGGDAPIAIGLELRADRLDAGDDLGIPIGSGLPVVSRSSDEAVADLGPGIRDG